jgi:hypothetical protein
LAKFIVVGDTGLNVTADGHLEQQKWKSIGRIIESALSVYGVRSGSGVGQKNTPRTAITDTCNVYRLMYSTNTSSPTQRQR